MLTRHLPVIAHSIAAILRARMRKKADKSLIKANFRPGADLELSA